MMVTPTTTSVADPDPVPFGPLDPGSGMGKKSGSGSGMEKIQIRDKHPGSATLITTKKQNTERRLPTL